MRDSIRVLHAEDDPGFADLIKSVLEETTERLTVETVTHPHEALDRLAADDGIDCVVSDYEMPGMDGIEFLEAVRETHPDLPFLLFTGKGSEEIASEAISAGVTDYLQKGSGTEQYDVLANRVTNAVVKNRAVRALEDERDRLSVLFENATDAIVFYEFEGEDPVARWVNPAFEETFGYDASAVVGESLEALLVPPECQEEGASINRQVRAGERVEREVTRQTADGRREFRLRSVPLAPGESGERGYVIYTDVTPQKERERELVRAKQRYRRLAEQDLFGIYVVQDGVVEYANPKAAELFGYAPEEVQGRSVFDLVVESDHDRIRENMRLREEGDVEDLRYNVTGCRKDGTEFAAELHGGIIEYEGDPALLGAVRDVTERRERERRLNARSAAIEASIDGLAIIDEEGTYEFVNRALADIHGYEDPEALVGESWQTCYDQAEIDRVEAEVVPVLFEEGSWRGEGTGLRKDGSTFPQELSLTLLSDQRVICVVRDITERKERERELEQSRQRYRTLLDGAPDAIFVADPGTGEIRETNEAATRLLDRPQDEIVGMHQTELHPPEKVEEYMELFEEHVAAEGGRDDSLGSQIDLYVLDANGERVPVEINARVVEIEDQTLIQGFFRNITERKEREQELRETNRLLETLLDTTAAAVFVKDTEGRYQLINERYRELLALPDTGAAIGRTDEELLPDDLARRRRAVDQRVVNEGGPIRIQESIPAPEGERTFLTLTGAMVDESGEPTGICGIATDITKRVEYEQEVARQNERLEEFASVVSHDLRNPLQVAEGHLDLAREERDSEHLDRVADALDRSETLIDDLLELARQGDTVSEVEPVALDDAIDDCWQHVDTGDAALVVESGDTILADGSRLRQLLENLLGNAIDHGGEDVTITVGEMEGGFYVADDGPGIPPEKREEVFESGYSTTADGTGFGLSIVGEIAEAHGWEVAVSDSEAGGARFEITGVSSAATRDT